MDLVRCQATNATSGGILSHAYLFVVSCKQTIHDHDGFCWVMCMNLFDTDLFKFGRQMETRHKAPDNVLDSPTSIDEIAAPHQEFLTLPLPDTENVAKEERPVST